MSTYNPQYIADLVNRQLSLVSQKVDAGLITNVEALDTIEPIHKHLRTVMDNIQRSIKASIDSMPTVKVDEYRIEEHNTCVQCSGKGRVWHTGCGDTDEPCMPCEGTGFNLDMRVY